jgi:glycosyltransferase involved in cell wall biosynthesis
VATKIYKISAINIIDPNWFDDLKHLPKCLQKLDWVDERIIIPTQTTTKLKSIAQKYQAKIIQQKGGKFADWRNLGAKHAQGKWLLYVDADERVSPQLKQEILQIISKSDALAAYAIPRSNKILGVEFRYGGWYPDYVLRLIQKDKLIKWQGDLHEQPIIKGDISHLKNHLLHIKFQELESYVTKTVRWSQTEAQLMKKAQMPQLNTLRLLRLTINPFITSLLKCLIWQKGIFDGTEGLIDAVYQSYSQFINYARLWELQSSNQLKTRN